MSLEPQKFFIGVIDVFSVLMPGALVAFLARDWVAQLGLWSAGWPLRESHAWVAFLFLSYLLGHVTFGLGAQIDRIYDALRKRTDLRQIERLSKGKSLSPRWVRTLANKLFGALGGPDAAVSAAIRLKARALRPQSAADAVNAFQWCKAILSKDHPGGLAAVQRFEADSKFFRSFAFVLFGLAIYCVWHGAWAWAAASVAALAVAFWRYVDQRSKSTEHAYALVIALEGMRVPPMSAFVRDEPDRLTHAGGVVFRESKDGVQYLLVESSAPRGQLVLPKGHIEPGEMARAAAVREVREETGHWAKVVDWIDDVTFSNATSAAHARFFLMELVEVRDEHQPPWPIDRQHEWLPLEAALERAAFVETETLLRAADDRRRVPSAVSTNRRES